MTQAANGLNNEVEIDLSDLIAMEHSTPNAPNFEDDAPTEVEIAEPATQFKGAYIQWNRHEGQWLAYYNGKVVMRNSQKKYGGDILVRNIQNRTNKKVELLGITHGVVVSEDFKIPSVGEKINTTKLVEQLSGGIDFGKHDLASEFSIGERFQILEKFVSSAAYMAIAEDGSLERLSANPMVTITGAGGLGKSYTTRSTLERHGLQRSDDMDIGDVIYGRAKGYAVISGYSTAKALYRKLWEHREGWVVVLDDCDSTLRSEDAINILKGAGDSGERRIISWNAESVRPDDELPKSFEFKSSVIIITNIDRKKLPQPLRSRSMNADVSMTREEVIQRIETLVEEGSFMAEYPIDAKYDVLDYLKYSVEHDTKFNALVKTINLRTFIVAVKAWVSHKGENWERAALYNMASASEE